MDFLVVLQAWHRKDQPTPENEKWVKPLHHNPLLTTVLLRENDLGPDTTRTAM